MGRVTWDGWTESCRMVWRAGLNSVFGSDDPAGIGITVEAGEVAAGYLQPDLVPRLEHVAGGPQVNGIAIGPPRLHQRRAGHGLPIAGPNNAVGQVAGAAVLANVHQLGSEIGVGGRSGGPQL